MGHGSEIPRPRGRPRDTSVDAAVLQATFDVLIERGYPGATMDAIAEQAGVGKNTIYRRWSSKEDLIADAFAGLVATARAASETRADEGVREWLHTQAEAMQRSMTEGVAPRVWPHLLSEIHRNPKLADAWAREVVRPRQRAIRQRLREAIECGEVRRDAQPSLVVDLLTGPILLHLASPWGRPRLTRRYAHALAETIWRGIAPD